MIEADVLVLIREGKIWETGTYNQLKAIDGDFTNLINKSSSSNQSDSENKPYSDDTIIANSSVLPDQDMRTSRRASVASPLRPPKKRPDVEAVASRIKPQIEPPRRGGVGWNVYSDYAKASNLLALAIYTAALLCAQIVELGELSFLH